MDQDIFLKNLTELPYFRAMLRAVEAKAYQDIPLEEPILDIGCGDGHFAETAFKQRIDVGLDYSFYSLLEAKGRKVYHDLINADATRLPFGDASFRTIVSTSTLEHIQDLERLFSEVSRVARQDALFYFCVPNHHFNENLSVARFLQALKLPQMAGAYQGFYDRIARHKHLDPPEVWSERLDKVGFSVDRWWHYFSPAALRVLEWGHVFGIPSLIVRKLIGRWNLVQQPWNFSLTRRLIEFSYEEPTEIADGVCTFYIAHKKS